METKIQQMDVMLEILKLDTNELTLADLSLVSVPQCAETVSHLLPNNEMTVTHNQEMDVILTEILKLDTNEQTRLEQLQVYARIFEEMESS